MVSNPLKNVSQLGCLFPIYRKIKHVPVTTNQSSNLLAVRPPVKSSDVGPKEVNLDSASRVLRQSPPGRGDLCGSLGHAQMRSHGPWCWKMVTYTTGSYMVIYIYKYIYIYNINIDIYVAICWDSYSNTMVTHMGWLARAYPSMLPGNSPHEKLHVSRILSSDCFNVQDNDFFPRPMEMCHDPILRCDHMNQPWYHFMIHGYSG